MSEQDDKKNDQTTQDDQTTKTDDKTIDDEKWDKERQRADQAEAELGKATTERDDLSDELAETHTEIEGLKSQIAEIEAKSEKPDDFKTLDSELVDPAVAHNLKTLQDKLAKTEKQLTDQQAKIDTYEKQEAEKQKIQQHEETVEQILSLCDDDYGAKYRNAAIKLADEITAKEKRPKDFIAGLKLMKKCYKQVKEAEDKKTSDKTVPTDSGGGDVPFDDTKLKTGSRQEVLADMQKRGLKA